MNNKISILTIICLVLGVIAGYTIPNFMNSISFIGNIYINLLKLIIIPILIPNIILSIYKLIKDKITTKLLFKTIMTFIIMFVLTFILTSSIVVIINGGVNYKFTETLWYGKAVELNVKDIITNLFPNNIITMITNNSLLPIIIFSTIFGICATQVKNSNKLIEIIEIIKDILLKILKIITYLTPIAVFSLMGTTIAKFGSVILNVGAKYILISYLCGLIVMFLIMILPVWIIAKINPITYLKKVYKVWLISTSTCSSIATLPETIKTCNDEFNIPNKITNLVVPLGCTLNMCGGAVSFALLGIFCCQMYGIEIDIAKFLMMLGSATIINMSAPGIPGGGIVIGASYLMLLKIPLNFIGFYSGIYRMLDMNYTTLNVTGDITASILINQHLNNKSLKRKKE